MSKRNISMGVVVLLVVAGAIVFWKVKQAKARAARRESAILRALSREDVAFLVKSHAASNPEKADAIVTSPENRKAFLKGLREYLAIAARAKTEGFGEDQNS